MFILFVMVAHHMLPAQVPESDTGTQSIEFVSENFNDFDEVLDEFQGKYILIDFWATWCKPCIEEFSHYDRINEFMNNEQDAISLFVSLDGARKHKWSEFVQKKQLSGYHYLASREVHEELFNDWGISTIPRYMIISPEGEILDQNAPRPSQGKSLIRRLEKLMK